MTVNELHRCRPPHDWPNLSEMRAVPEREATTR